MFKFKKDDLHVYGAKLEIPPSADDFVKEIEEELLKKRIITQAQFDMPKTLDMAVSNTNGETQILFTLKPNPSN